MDTAKSTEYRRKIVENVEKVIVVNTDIIELARVCFLCGGHILLEDVPGTGKTIR